MDPDDLRWTQDQDYVWHACDKNKQVGTTVCGQIEAARSGIFKYPRHMLSFGDVCRTCNDKATIILNPREVSS